ncbi:protein of unknown function [Pseudomonas sp. NFPP33]|nr:DUF4145 domain-containing protein [Pseudomonas sp. NFPP33]SDA83193.1 protein of unknown function [Pseudomonas sp. NFPP33]
MGNTEKTFLLESNVPGKYKFICRECSKETTHLIVAAYKESGSQDCGGGNNYDWNEVSQIIQCQGCEAVSFRVESTNSEDYEYDYESNSTYSIETIKFYPGRSAGLKAIDSYLLPLNVQEIYKETILAIENEQNILAGIGVRALVETICKDLNAEGKDLYNKINSLREKAIVTKEGVETLHKLRVLGNDAAHEVKKHNHQQLSLAIQIIEHMLDGTYIIPHKVAHVLK